MHGMLVMFYLEREKEQSDSIMPNAQEEIRKMLEEESTKEKKREEQRYQNTDVKKEFPAGGLSTEKNEFATENEKEKQTVVTELLNENPKESENHQQSALLEPTPPGNNSPSRKRLPKRTRSPAPGSPTVKKKKKSKYRASPGVKVDEDPEWKAARETVESWNNLGKNQGYKTFTDESRHGLYAGLIRLCQKLDRWPSNKSDNKLEVLAFQKAYYQLPRVAKLSAKGIPKVQPLIPLLQQLLDYNPTASIKSYLEKAIEHLTLD